MRRFLVLLALVALVLLSGEPVAAKAKKSDEIREETVDAASPGDKQQPNLSPEAFAKIFEKLSSKCQKEIEANPADPEQLSPRCRSELGRKIERHIQREKEGPKEKKQEKPQQPKKKKSKKQSRAQKEAAAAVKKEEEYYETVKVIVGFVATFIAVIIGVMVVINRKLKAAGMYYPANPEERSSGGCCG